AATALPAVADTVLPKDPGNVYGKFDNGLSYIIRRHNNPPGRVALYLHIKSGSLNESETQNGLAHFIEHMAFNGSKHFPPGELIPYLNKMGMEFGHDTNAHTSYDETVYKLFMPNVKDETVDKAMTVLADFAYGLALLPEEIEKERGVILEEARSQKSAAERIRKAMMKAVFEGSRVAVHDVIGDEKQIAKWQKSDFDDYWNTWYRPENMTLIVVGEIEPDKIVAMAQKYFGEFKPRAEARKPLSGEIKPVEKARAFVLTDPEQVQGQIQMMAVKPGRPPMKTYSDYRLSEVENIGTWMVSRRLQEMVEKGTAAFRGADTGISSMLHETILPEAVAMGEPQDWNKMLDQVVVEINRAVEHGFSERELALARQEFLSNAERAVEKEPTLDARVFINRFSGAVGEDEAILSAQQRLDLMKQILSEANLPEVQKVFVGHYKTRNFSYVLIMPEKKEGLKLPSSEEVLAAASEAWARKTEAVKEEKSADSILPKLPEPGKVEKQTTDDDLKITTILLDNGVTVHHRFMDYKKDQVLVRITIPGGTIEETADNHGVGQVAGLAFGQPATSRLDSTQVRDLMTGKKVDVDGHVGLDALSLSVTGSPKEMEVGMQLAYALLTDGKVEQSAFDNWKKQMLQRIEMMKKMPQGQLMKAMEQAVFAGDVRLSMLTPEEVEKLDVKKGQDWLKHVAASGGMEVAVVGDIPLEDCLKLVTRYLGSLPKQPSSKQRLDPLRKLNRGPGPYTKTVKFESVTPKAMVLAGFVSCNERDTLDRRLLMMASRILSDRMIKRIREEERLVYSIGCQNQAGDAIPGLGMMFAAAPTDPDKSDRLADLILEMMKDFAKNGPTEEEVAIAKKQIANDLDTSLKEPSYWAQSLEELEYRGKTLAELKELPDVYQTFTDKQLQETVQKYLKDDKVIRLVVNPELKEGAAPATRPAAPEDASSQSKEKPKASAGEQDKPKQPAQTDKANKSDKPDKPKKGQSRQEQPAGAGK
ncbi:MAG TPA: insulinase family protein, partial [Phycisphaerae bacterium]|nr:insulinase family protein [Phycisphaerae bacterium]